MGLRQLSCYRPPDPRILSRRRRIWSRGGRTRRPDVGRRLSPRPETRHPPVGGEVLIGLVASRSRRPDRRHQAPSVWVMTTISGSHRPAGAKGDSARRRFKPSAPRSDDRGSKPPPTVPDRSREVKVHYGRAEFATFGGGGVDRRRRGGIQSRARPSPPAPRACCVASPAANRRTASCRHLSGRSHRARLATRDTPDDPARSARASARGASGARAAASNHWRLQLQQRAAARSIDLMGAAKNQKEAGG